MVKRQNPRWWLLYLTMPLMIGLLVLEGRLPEPPVVHQIMEMGIVIVCFGLMAVWVHANEGARVNEEFEKEHWNMEPDLHSEPDLDPRHLPLADAGEDKDREPYPLEASPTKGRFN